MSATRLDPFDLLGPGGRVACKLPAFEARAEQVAMAGCVADALANRRHAVIEAGTGVGKSFGYLVPAILHALETKKAVVVATNTIALQEQLANKDIPFLQSALPVKFSAVLAKGRGNYVSIRRLHKAQTNAISLFDGGAPVDQIDKIADWAGETGDGSLADLPFEPLPGVWEQVQSDRGNCLGRKCPTYKDCFYFAARKRYALANVLIVNHHLLFTDLAVRSRSGMAGILPKYGAVVIDEAHATEDVASHCLGHRLSEAQLRRYLLGLFNARRNKGALANFHSTAAMNARIAVATTLDATRTFFAHLQEWAIKNQPPATRGREGRLESVRVREPLPHTEALSDAFDNLIESLYAMKETMTEEEDELEIESQIGRALEHIGTVKLFLQAGDDDAVFWVEPAPRTREGAKEVGDDDSDDRPRRSATLHIAPIEVGPLLRKDLFDKIDTVVLTSATIASGTGPRAFDHFCERVGLTGTFTTAPAREAEATVSDLAFDLEVRAQGAGPGGAGDSPARSRHVNATTAEHPPNADLKGWYQRSDLLHFDGGPVPQFITFRLADSFPRQRLLQWRRELAALSDDEADAELRDRVESYLDAGHGQCWLGRTDVAAVVQDTMLRFHGARYALHAWVIMPNHVHALVTPTAATLPDIIHAWKSYTAKAANALLERVGSFWQADYFDRFIREREHAERTVEYIHWNPVKAGLCREPSEWRFGSASREWDVGGGTALAQPERAGESPAPPAPDPDVDDFPLGVNDDEDQARADLIARRRAPLRLHLGSPFDFAGSVRLRVPRDLPDPRDAKADDVMVRWIAHAIDANAGATFVLFTNTGQMLRAADRVQAILGDAYPILKQGDGASRSQLLERFKRETASVLFGVASFWQGVDVPGDALTQVIIARLPFAVPSDPVIAARSERIESRGGHAFGDYSLPEAIIKFKQGFGRLIRTATDRGVVVVLDPRIVTKPYGRRFIEALPPVPLERPTLPS